jgi:GR25 family glycosyltransferase involved in LPS biosynthesis
MDRYEIGTYVLYAIVVIVLIVFLAYLVSIGTNTSSNTQDSQLQSQNFEPQKQDSVIFDSDNSKESISNSDNETRKNPDEICFQTSREKVSDVKINGIQLLNFNDVNISKDIQSGSLSYHRRLRENKYELTSQPERKFPYSIYIINLARKPERYIYVKEQLDRMGISDYYRIIGVDGFETSREDLVKFGLTYELTERRGIAGCAASHIKMWKFIAENKLGWSLILEDDAHFHPNFLELFNEYWVNVPKLGIQAWKPHIAKIVFAGFCTDNSVEQTEQLVVEHEAMCLQGYMLSWEGAQYLLDNLLPMNDPVDISINEHFKLNPGSFVFNGNAKIKGIRPNDYKEANGRQCMFNGIIYQNHEQQGSTIHQPETTF